jgi:integrase
MSASTLRDVEWARAWKAGHPDYPLTPHPSGQWTKKVRGKVHYFGILGDPDNALRLWLQEKDYHLAGLPPPANVGGLTVEQLLDRHLQDVDDRIAAGKLSRNTRNDYRLVRRAFRDVSLLRSPVAALTPIHFSSVLKEVEKSGRCLRSQRNVIVATKAVLNWGSGMGLFPALALGPRFVSPGTAAIEVEQEASGRCRFIEREAILHVLGVDDKKMNVAVLLGINCGFYYSDSMEITLDRLHLDEAIPYHDFRRPKTKKRRMAVLWPETVEAIRDYISVRPPSEDKRLLVTRNGEQYSKENGNYWLAEKFNRLLRKIGAYRKGVSIGSLRHTYGTVVDLVPDQAMIDLTMGHTNKSLQKRVYKQLNLDELSRLEVVADTVREWLYGKGVGT